MMESDLTAVEQLERACFQDPWTYHQLYSELRDNPFSAGWVLEENGKVAGFAFVWHTFERAELSNIAIAPACQHQGHGRWLLKTLMDSAARQGCEFMNLEVRSSNANAYHLYESLGFVPVRQVRGYYDNGEDAIMMSAPLPGAQEG